MSQSRDLIPRLTWALKRAIQQMKARPQATAEEDIASFGREIGELLEDIGIVYWLTDWQRNEVLFVSGAYETTWERSCDSLYGDPGSWADLVHPDDRDRVREAFAKNAPLGTYDELYRLVLDDGSVRWIHDRAFPIRDSESVVTLVAGISEDVTARVERERAEREEERMRAIGRFASGAAGVLREHLGGARAATERLCSELSSSSDGGPEARAATAALDRLEAITTLMLGMTSRQPKNARDVDLPAAVADVVELIRPLVGDETEISVDPPSRPVFVRADLATLGRVVVSLIDDLRRSGARRCTMTFEEPPEAEPLHDDELVGPRLVTLVVQGTGGDGIPRPGVVGSFLGQEGPGSVSLARKWIEEMAGSLSVETCFGSWTTFRVRIPRVDLEAGREHEGDH